ncbi:MAG TPA: MFS transporter [Thermoanaerobaculia bacterium]|nr:MFS transporter [Thermoanaerobaculia bacterium]
MSASAASPPPVPGRRRAFTAIFVTILLDLIGFGMILPQLPYFAQELHATPAMVGLLFSSYSLAQFLFAPLLGRLSDRIGRRPVLLVSICGSAAAHLIFAFAGSFWTLVLARSLAGVAAANYSIAQAYMADVSTAEDRSKAMGLVGAAFGIGFVLGPAFGGFLALLHPRAAPLAASALSAANFLIALSWLPESLPPQVRELSRSRPWIDPSGLGRMWRNVPLRGLMLLFFLVMFCFSLFEATLALYCQSRFGFGRTEISYLFAYVGVVLVVVQGALLGRLVRRFGERRLILWGIFLMAAGLAVLPSAPTVWQLAACLALLAVGSGVHNPSTMGLLSRLTNEGSQGGTIGLSRSFGALARTLGPATGTWIFGAVGAAWPFWTAGGLMLFALVIAWGVLSRAAPALSASPPC